MDSSLVCSNYTYVHRERESDCGDHVGLDDFGCPNSDFLLLTCLFRSYNSFTKGTEGHLMPKDMFFSAHVIFKAMLPEKHMLF